MGLETANFAEFMAVLLAVELAHNKAWRRVWFEMDSSLTLYIFDKKDHVPHSKIRRRWERCMHLLADMEIRTSHIVREGNVPPDSLSNIALNVDSFCW